MKIIFANEDYARLAELERIKEHFGSEFKHAQQLITAVRL